jgi:hypothetical protein
VASLIGVESMPGHAIRLQFELMELHGGGETAVMCN